MSKLNGKVALVIGGTTGMGLASAKRFLEEGATVYVTGRRQETLDEALAELGPGAVGVQGDLARMADLDRLYATIGQAQRGLDVVFVSAGIGHADQFLPDVTEQLFHDTFVTNVKNVLFAVQKALPLLRDGSSIILNSSIAHLKGLPGMSVYSASKAAVRSFARSWAMELKDRQIRVNVISPGPIDTPFTAPASQEWKEMMTRAVPLGRFGRADEIATAALFLASPDSSYITGVDLCVDGGLTQV
ncbi:SDR family oxidoreductase [Stenotrophomonas sp. 24(2023)]|uniref:SDR family NAD(P)-dependent oxidoreductase n=1 Tax=Stenotrophomonas sp. 24(2023) TaxID=3068324 RepID=UPI0027E04EDF|nr:SDR family oxidoreductase [Stenotrophomonas sp. 24(2023)]WMJ68225.1 SDR family oxidoreductase [Stenotrophomonas sp. 24(2023)]